MRAKRRSAELTLIARHVTEQVIETLSEDIVTDFPNILNLSPYNTVLRDYLRKRIGTELVISNGIDLQADDEYLPFTAGSLNLVVSNLSLHWVNDIPGSFIQIFRLLKEKGFFIATMFGPSSLKELKASLLHAEALHRHGASMRTIPLVEVKEAGHLLQRAGFHMPVAHSETLEVHYPTLHSLIDDLRTMSETNALLQRNKSYPGKWMFNEVDAYYKTHFCEGKDLVATIEIVTVSGWKS